MKEVIASRDVIKMSSRHSLMENLCPAWTDALSQMTRNMNESCSLNSASRQRGPPSLRQQRKLEHSRRLPEKSQSMSKQKLEGPIESPKREGGERVTVLGGVQGVVARPPFCPERKHPHNQLQLPLKELQSKGHTHATLQRVATTKSGEASHQVPAGLKPLMRRTAKRDQGPAGHAAGSWAGSQSLLHRSRKPLLEIMKI